MRTIEAIKLGAIKLKNVKKPMKESRILMQHFLKCNEVDLILKEDMRLEKENDFFALIEKRKNHFPIEYIINKVSFYSKEFEIYEGVLIPRSETEILVDKVIEIIKNMHSPRIVEIGTGSGIISVMLAVLKNDAKIIATDINIDAINLAKKNAQNFGVYKKINFIHTSFLDGIEEEFDILVSNPPYIANDYILDTHVLKEPHNALFGGKEGFEILAKIIKLSEERKINNIVCEMGYDQKEKMKKLLLNYEEIEFYKDLSGFNRGFVAKNIRRKKNAKRII